MRRQLLIFTFLCFPAALVAQDGTWLRLGPPGGTVMALGTSPLNGMTYLGTADGHVFVSSDGARHWELRSRIGARTDTVVTRLLVDPTHTDVIYAAAWYQQPGTGGGVFRSEDGGRTWRLLGLGQEQVRALEVASVQPLTLVAGTRSGVFRSEDTGQSWQRITPADNEELRNVDSLAVDPKDSNVIYVGTYHLPWKTTDGGKTWKPVTAGLIDDSDIMSIRVDATNPERLFISACSGIYRSENKGGQWTKLQGIPYAARRTHSIVQDPQNPQTLYAATTEGLWLTRDGGESWKRTTPGEWVVNSVSVLRSANGKELRVVLGTETLGILVSDDSGEVFRASNEGFSHQVVKQLIADPLDSTHLLMVLEQNGSHILESHDSAHSWVDVSLQTDFPRGKRASVDSNSIQKLYGSAWGWLAQQSGRYLVFDAASETWHEWKPRLIGEGAIPARKPAKAVARTAAPPKPVSLEGPLVFSQSFAFVPASSGLLRCDRDGKCGALKAFVHLANLRAVHSSSEGTVLAVIADSKLGISYDGGQSAVWKDLPVAQSAVHWLEKTAKSSQGHSALYLGTTEGIYTSQDEGVSWKRLEGGLPATQFETWLDQPDFMAATLREGGIYASSDQAKNWIRIDQDAERSRIVGVVETEPGELVLGSQSEGVLLFHVSPAPR